MKNPFKAPKIHAIDEEVMDVGDYENDKVETDDYTFTSDSVKSEKVEIEKKKLKGKKKDEILIHYRVITICCLRIDFLCLRICFWGCICLFVTMLSLSFFSLFQVLEYVDYSSGMEKSSDLVKSIARRNILLTQDAIIGASHLLQLGGASGDFEGFGGYLTDSVLPLVFGLGMVSTEVVLLVPPNHESLYNEYVSFFSLDNNVILLNTSFHNLNPSVANHLNVFFFSPISEENSIGNTILDSMRVAKINEAYSSGSSRSLVMKNSEGDIILEHYRYVNITSENLELSVSLRTSFDISTLLYSVFEDQYEYEIIAHNSVDQNENFESGDVSSLVKKSFLVELGGTDIEVSYSNNYNRSSHESTKIFMLILPLVLFILCMCCCCNVQTFISQCLRRKRGKKDDELVKNISNAIATFNFDDEHVQSLVSKDKNMKKWKTGSTEESLTLLIKSVKRIRKFLPRTLIKQLELERENLSSSTLASDNSSSSSTSGSTINSIHSFNETDLEDCKISSALLDSGTHVRDVVLLSVTINMDDMFLKYTRFNKIRDFRRIYVEYITIVFLIMKEHKGDFHHFEGSKILFSWGAVSEQQRIKHVERHICCAALKIAQHSFFREYGFRPLISIIRGDALVGNFNLEKIDIYQFGMIGHGVSLMEKLTDLNKKHNTSILMNQAMMELVKYSADVCVVDVVQFGVGRNAMLDKIYTLVASNNWKEGEGEDIYEMHKVESKLFRTFSLVDSLWDDLIAGERESAWEKMRQHLKKSPSDEVHFSSFQNAYQRVSDGGNLANVLSM